MEHYAKKQGTAQHDTSQKLKQVQGDKIIREGEGIKTRPKEARSYQTNAITSKGHISLFEVFQWPKMDNLTIMDLKHIKLQELMMILIK